MTPTLLREVGEAMDGDRWMAAMARRRQVNERTVRRWASGTSPIPDGLWLELRADISERRGELGELIKKLPK